MGRTEGIKSAPPGSAGNVVELFAGVGGFRLGLERSGWRTVWANQWEPGVKVQHAADCYRSHWDDGTLVNEDIARVLDQIQAGEREPIPDFDLLVGGFPCQDYSVAKTLSQAQGIQGKKGVLWWQIHRILEDRQPRMVFLENVDRLLKSPATQRGRDFAIILASLDDLGYMVEWRVVNAAEYGFPQRRRRVFLIARPKSELVGDPEEMVFRSGVLAQALPAYQSAISLQLAPDVIEGSLEEITDAFGTPGAGPFRQAGFMVDRKVWTFDVRAKSSRKAITLGDVLMDEDLVAPAFYIPDDKLGDSEAPARGTWRYLKGAKRERRATRLGFEYDYTEGGIAFPDPLDKASRTVLTGEGGPSPSRFKHAIQTADGRYRRLVPEELERLNGFPTGWTAGLSDGKRAFVMGNALVVGLIEKVGASLASVASS